MLTWIPIRSHVAKPSPSHTSRSTIIQLTLPRQQPNRCGQMDDRLVLQCRNCTVKLAFSAHSALLGDIPRMAISPRPSSETNLHGT